MTNNGLNELLEEQINAVDAYTELVNERSRQQGTDPQLVPVVVTSMNDELVLAKKRVDAAELAVKSYWEANSPRM